jgi:uncharacterized membrane protein YhaH (DUF805 family)
MSWYLRAFQKYAVFAGRARRKEYWMFTLFNIIVSVLFGVVSAFAGNSNSPTNPVNIAFLVYLVLSFIPSLALTVRRLHDTERGTGWLFISLVPFVGAIVLLWFLCSEGWSGHNKYGADPKTA